MRLRSSSKKSAQRFAQPARQNSNSSSSSASTAPEDGPPPLPPEEKLRINCERVLELLDSLGTSFGEFLVAVCYGASSLRNVESAIKARKSLYEKADRLETFLENSYRAPRPPNNHGPRPAAGTKTIRQFACSIVKDVFASELDAFSEDYIITDSQLADVDYIAEITSDLLFEKVQTKCPELSTMLAALTGKPLEEEENEDEEEEEEEPVVGPKLPRKKHKHFNIVFQVTSMAFRMKPRRNVLQKLLTTYMHAKHTGKAVLDILQQAGITMSYSWMRRAISNLSADIHNQLILAAHDGPFGVSHDNVRFKFPVASQRGDNQSVSDNGTAITLLVFPRDSARAFEDPDDFKPFYRTLKAQRIAGTAPRLGWKDLVNPTRQKYNRTSSIYDVLDLFRMIPELAKSDLWKTDKLKRPTGPQQLPHGPEHRLRQFMLPTTNIDESSYSGNSQVIPYTLKHLKLDIEPERTRLTLERLIVWIGDQMTAQRCRQVQWYRQESINGFNRWDPLIFIFGGFHAQMTLGHSILEGFRGSNAGATFGSDIILLSRTGLQKTIGKKRLDFHTVDEFLLHEAEAHFRGLFMHLTGCESGKDITTWLEGRTADDLFQLARDALCHHASSGALALNESDDEMRPVIIKRQRELLLYHSVRRAFKHGDIDRIEALLPELLFYYIGAGNSNYAKEVFEFLQLITHESTPAVRAAILRHGLVVNKLGREDSFYPIDQRQEFNNAGIRDYGPPPQSSSWQQYGEVSGVIPFFMDVVSHVEDNITGISRSHIHKNPKREMDVQALIAAHRKHRVHDIVPGREIPSANKAKDARKAGISAIRDRNVLAEYHKNREVYFRAACSKQVYEDLETPPPSPTFLPTHPSRPLTPTSPMGLP